jgi:RNA polymerase sigma-70 factor (ECF subfamily)
MDKNPEVSYVSKPIEDVIDLQEALSVLDKKSRMIIVMRYFEDLPIKEIAGVLEMPESSVKTVIYRGLGKLKINMKGSEYFG